MSENYFPIQFMTIGNKSGAGGTQPGLYLRWLVQPYLGVPGISPFYPHDMSAAQWQDCGFRLFSTSRLDDSQTTKGIPIDPLLPYKANFGVSEVFGRPNWRACYGLTGHVLNVQLDLTAQFQHGIRYLRFNYALFADQRIELKYTIRNGQSGGLTDYTVHLDYPALSEDLAHQVPAAEFERPHVDLTYAIHVDQVDDSIETLEFNTTRFLVLGDFEIAGPGAADYYRWSPPGGDHLWTEIPQGSYLFGSLNSALIRPAEPVEMPKALEDFYQTYYGEAPANLAPNQILFDHPALPGLPLLGQPAREYLCDQYEQLCRGQMDAGLSPNHAGGFHLRPQDAAWLAANDPAIAYLFGLFRVLNEGAFLQQKVVYKVQGQWPDGKRFCIYSLYDPAQELAPPQIQALSTRAGLENRTLRDYATFRTHHPLKCTELSWQVIPAQNSPGQIWLEPLAYLVLRSAIGSPYTCLSPFFLPVKEDTHSGGSGLLSRFLDWYDQYPNTDIPKTLDGKYHYLLTGFDLFGQMSNFLDKEARIEAAPLAFGEIHAPLIHLLDAAGKAANPPLEVELTANAYCDLFGQSKNAHLHFSFFWPLESRYIWDRNRATQAVSLDSFRLYYLPETPLFAPIRLQIVNWDPDYLDVALEEVRPSSPGQDYSNGQLFDLLQHLGATNGALLEPATVQTLLEGGKLQIVREFQVISVIVWANTSAIGLRISPTRDLQSWVQEERLNEVIHARLYWNSEAVQGGVRLGWKPMNLVGEKLVPAPLQLLHSPLQIQNRTPNTPPVHTTAAPLTDLPITVGLVGYAPPPAEERFDFSVTIPSSDPLAGLDRFLLTPRDPLSGLEPGEFFANQLPPDWADTPPASAHKLFSTERIISFSLVRQPPDANHPNQLVFRGEPIMYTSRPTANSGPQETLLFPDPLHSEWVIVPPNSVVREVRLSEFLGDGIMPPIKPFTAEHTLSTNITVAVEAVAGTDPEVHTTLQDATAALKLTFHENFPPPVFKETDQSQPDFGIPAGRPGYNGLSLIGLRKIFENYDLQTMLPTNLQYILLRLPADRIITLPGGGNLDHMPVQYADKNPPNGVYRRDMQAVRNKLDLLKSANLQWASYLDIPALQDLFRSYAERVNPSPIDKQSFLRLPVTLPGETRTVFLFAIKAYDPISGKESESYSCLSKPVYVEDTTLPVICPHLSVVVKRHNTDTLRIEAKLPRKKSAADGYGFVTQDELVNDGLLGACLPNFAAQYLIYATNQREMAASPTESDFVPLGASDVYGASVGVDRKFTCKLLPDAITLTASGDQAELTGNIQFSQAFDLGNIREEVFICIRAENYLGERGILKFVQSYILG